VEDDDDDEMSPRVVRGAMMATRVAVDANMTL